MAISQLGNNPILHSAAGAIGSVFAPHLDDARNVLEVDAQKFNTLLKLLDEIAVDPNELSALITERRRKLFDMAEAEMDKVPVGDLRARKAVYEDRRVRAFRVLIRHPSQEHSTRTKYAYEFRRYVLKYDQTRQAQSEHAGALEGVTAQYVVRVFYNLVHVTASRRRPEAYSIETMCNATALEGESGSPFSSRMYNLQPHEWEDKIIETYVKPYQMLEHMAHVAEEGIPLSRLTRLTSDMKMPGKFTFGLTTAQYRKTIRVQTFGFRWLMTLGFKEGKDPRQLMLLMLFVLYNSNRRFLDRDVSVSKGLNMQVEISRRGDPDADIFARKNAYEEPPVDAHADHDPMTVRINRAFEEHGKQPIVSLRLRVQDSARKNLYTASLHLPSLRYLQMQYRYTDHITAPTVEIKSKMRDAWKLLATNGIIIGIDAYSGYLHNRRNISTLDDLLTLFVKEYKRDIQRFCQQIFDTACSNIDIGYWLSERWTHMLEEPEIEGDDLRIWTWLHGHPDQNIVDLMIRKKLVAVTEVAGKYRVEAPDVKRIREVAQRWVTEYGYDPTYSMGAHLEVVHAWHLMDDARSYYSLKKPAVSWQGKVKAVRSMLKNGVGQQVTGLVDHLRLPPTKR